MYRTKKGLLLAKIESVYGTDPVPTKALNTIAAVNGEINWSPNFERLSRMIADSSTVKVSGFNAMPTVQLSFTVEARGNYTTGGTDTDISSGASAQAVEIDCLLRACDLAASYAPESVNGARDGSVSYTLDNPDDEGDSVTFYFYAAGKLHKVTGAKGTVKGTFEAGKIGKLEFTFSGLWNLPTDVAMPTSITWLDTKPPLFRSAAAVVDAWSPVFRSLNFDLGNNVVRRDDGNATTGVRGFIIPSRNPKMSIDPEATIEATKAIFGDLESSTTRTISATLGSTAGNKVQFIGTGEPVSAPYADANEIITHNIEFEILRANLSDPVGTQFRLKFF